MRGLSVHYAIGWLLVTAALGLVAFYAPFSAMNLGSNYLIFFFHFASAITCLLFFALAGLFSIAFLGTSETVWDRAAAAAVEVGVLGCTITMVTGSIWAKAAWNAFWVWNDPRLMTVAIMWLTYLAYLSLRSSIDLPAQRSRFSAVFGIIAAINIPLVWFSIRIFNERSHPMQVDMDPEIRTTMWSCALAFLVLYAAMWRHRMAVIRLQDEAREIEERLAIRGI